MNVKIDLEIAQNILKTYARRNKNQNRIYGILLGSEEGQNNFHVKNCIFGYIYETKDENQRSGPFKRLNDSITQSLIKNYQSCYPDQIILGGFSTDRDVFHELCLLYDTINDINTTVIPNRNKLLLLIDPFFDDKESFEIGMKFFNWEPDTDTKSINYQIIPHEVIDHKVPTDKINSNFLKREEVYVNINNMESSFIDNNNFDEIKEKLNFSEKISIHKDQNDNIANLNNFKIKLNSIQKFLNVIEGYLEGNIENLDRDMINKIEMIINEFLNTLDNQQLFEEVVKEFKQNQMINTLSNLLKLQVNITEKINEKNI